MYIKNIATMQHSTTEGGPECVNTADINNSPGGDDLIATPGSAV